MIFNRFKLAINNDEGSSMLEQIVIIGVLLLISTVLLILVFRMESNSQAKAGYSTTTGWFRTEDLTGIKN